MPYFNSAQHRLVSMARVPGISRELAYVLAGLLVALRVFRPARSPRPVTGITLAIAVLVLTGTMILSGPVIGAMAPLFWALGHLPGSVLTLAVLLLLLLRFRRVGRLYLSAL